VNSVRNATRKRSGFTGLLLLVAGLLTLIFGACGGSNDETFKVGARAPDFSLPAVGGGEVALADYAGKQPVLLYFHMAKG
jgi:hypothetical protein